MVPAVPLNPQVELKAAVVPPIVIVDPNAALTPLAVEAGVAVGNHHLHIERRGVIAFHTVLGCVLDNGLVDHDAAVLGGLRCQSYRASQTSC